jgi:hypothetical protein
MRCPVCKAEVAEGPLCRRCKADLSLLFQLEKQRERCCAAARQRLGEGRWSDAIRLAAQADGLRHDDESLRLAALGYLFLHDFEQALRYHRLASARNS